MDPVVEDASAGVAADAVDTAAAAQVANSVGNTDTTIDDSINLTDNSIDYPDDSQLTGNTGTAVSGNNNDIMPIINAPVTVIINNNDQPHTSRHNNSPSMPPGASIPPQQPFAQQQPQFAQQQTFAQQPQFAQQQQSFAQQQTFAQQPQFVQQQQPFAPQQPQLTQQQLLAPQQQPPADPLGSHLQQLIAYALALNQGNIAQAV
ncbi:hypothetical protein GGI15_001300 [Coemansia interrupta]|uniref:Uncharacterized protein n=1 Tax=Coemansia interrupta TaxID=1126814 RepID=A0A9W8LLJ4_9FUNG|nr:hypothetical protein GGI15_001300 [Coemansia interrupta]